MTNVTAEIVSVSDQPDGTMVDVRVTSPKMFPHQLAEMRARARAIVEAGVVDATTKAAENVTEGQIRRLTKVEGPPVTDRSRLTKTNVFTVIVKDR
jgi:uncharacterized protein YcgI (DUF1989 family)